MKGVRNHKTFCFAWPANAVEHKHQWPVKKLGSWKDISLAICSARSKKGVTNRCCYQLRRPTNQWFSPDFWLFFGQVLTTLFGRQLFVFLFRLFLQGDSWTLLDHFLCLGVSEIKGEGIELVGESVLWCKCWVRYSCVMLLYANIIKRWFVYLLAFVSTVAGRMQYDGIIQRIPCCSATNGV